MNFIKFRSSLRYKIGQKNTTMSLQTGVYYNYMLNYKKIDDGNVVDSGFNKNFGSVSDLGIGLGAALLIKEKVQFCGGYNIGLKTNYTMFNLTYFFGN